MRSYCRVTGKIRYDGRRDAVAHVRALRVSKRGKQKPASAYKCRDCGGWHVTSGVRRLP